MKVNQEKILDWLVTLVSKLANAIKTLVEKESKLINLTSPRPFDKSQSWFLLNWHPGEQNYILLMVLETSLKVAMVDLFLPMIKEVVTVVYNTCKLLVIYAQKNFFKNFFFHSFHNDQTYVETMNKFFTNRTKFHCTARKVPSWIFENLSEINTNHYNSIIMK